MKRQHDSDTSTLPNTWARVFCSLSDDIQHALRADSSTVAQQQQAVAAQIVYTDRVSPRASRLSVVYEDCLEGYGVKRGVYSKPLSLQMHCHQLRVLHFVARGRGKMLQTVQWR